MLLLASSFGGAGEIAGANDFLTGSCLQGEAVFDRCTVSTVSTVFVCFWGEAVTSEVEIVEVGGCGGVAVVVLLLS